MKVTTRLDLKCKNERQWERIFILSNWILYVNKWINPFAAGAAYIRVLIFYYHIKYHLLNIKCDINQQYLKTVDL